MLTIRCRKSKNGNDYLSLCYNDIILTVDERTILRVATEFRYSKRDVYQLDVGEHLDLVDIG